jgi:hypothetical protein
MRNRRGHNEKQRAQAELPKPQPIDIVCSVRGLLLVLTKMRGTGVRYSECVSAWGG